MSITMMNPTWYDLLDVEPDASTDEIRAAWKAAIADLEPTDRRFRTLNDAAAVLLDEKKRTAYDAELAEAEDDDTVDTDDEPEAEAEVEADAETEEQAEPAPLASADVDAEAKTDDAPPADEATEVAPVRTASGLPVWVIAAVGVLAAASLVAALVTVVWVNFFQTKYETVSNDNTTTSTVEGAVGKQITQNHTLLVEKDAADALTAAKKDVVPLLSYDYKAMAAAQSKAHGVMTKSYRDDYDRLFAMLVDNVPNTKTVVKTLPPVDAGIVRVGDNRVQVLVLVDRQVTNAERSQPIGYQEYATLTMEKVDGSWLVDEVTTVPGK